MELTIALNRYDRHVPFFNGTVTPPDGITLRPFQIGESTPMRDEAVPVELGGEIDALISPQPRKSMLARPAKVRRPFHPSVRNG